MRQNTKIIMLFTALAFVALMVFEWGMDMSGQSGGGGSLGRVDGTSVSIQHYQNTYRSLYDEVSRSQDSPISTVQNREIEDAAWDEVVNQILIEQELRRRGVRVTDAEIRQAARFSPPQQFYENPAFQTDGQFDIQKYHAFLASPQADDQLLAQLEAYYRDVIPRSKLLRQVTSGIYITDSKLWQAYRDEHEEVQVQYIPLNPAQRIADDAVTMPAAEIERYYRDRREDYAVPARATIRIVALMTTPTAADTAATIDRAEELREEIRGGVSFEEVAERESVDPGSASRGGDLGTFARGDMVGAFEDVAFSVPVGEISDPVRTDFGVHLIRVDRRTADSAQARHILIPFERTDESEIRLLTLADSLESLLDSRTLDDAAAEFGLEVRTHEITADVPFVPGIGDISEGVDWIFEEDEGLDVGSPVFEGLEAFYALEVIESHPEGYLTLDEVRSSIEETLRLRRKVQMAAEEGARMLAELREGGLSLEQIAERHDHDLHMSEHFTRDDFVPGLGRHNQAIGAAFGAREGEISDVVTTRTNAYILEVVDRVEADREAWEAQKEIQRARHTSA
ncbi:MAG: peptidylprolyl isomerase, partial [Gemmatimonadota bacterium]